MVYNSLKESIWYLSGIYMTHQHTIIFICILICTGIVLCESTYGDEIGDAPVVSALLVDSGPAGIVSSDNIPASSESISSSDIASSASNSDNSPLGSVLTASTTAADGGDTTDMIPDSVCMLSPSGDIGGLEADVIDDSSSYPDDSCNQNLVTDSSQSDEQVPDSDGYDEDADNSDNDKYIFSGSEPGIGDGDAENSPIQEIKPEEPELRVDREVTGAGETTGSLDVVASLACTARIIQITDDISEEVQEYPLILADNSVDASVPDVKTLAIVEVSLQPPGSTPLEAGVDNGFYTFTGNYLGGTIKIKKTGTYHLTDTLISNAGSGSSGTHNFAIKISGSNVILDGGHDSATGQIQNGITGNGANYLDGILVNGKDVTIQNFGSITGFTGISSAGVRSEITADGITVSGSTCTGNMYGILSYGATATIIGNSLTGNTNDGIRCVGTDVTITSNNLIGNDSDGIRCVGDGATINDNTAISNTNGISSGGGSATITGNTVIRNDAGIQITDNKQDVTVSGNHITDNTNVGIKIDHGVGTGSGAIYDNYFANNINVGGTGAPGTFDWNTDPIPGLNVMGGPTIAGNYWSNPVGTGWSDTRVINPAGYSTTEDYEVKFNSQVYDSNPLVRYPAPPVPPDMIGQKTSAISYSDNIPSGNFIHLVITNITVSSGTVPGSSTTLTLIIEADGSVLLPPGATVVFVPVNMEAIAISEFTATIEDREFDEVTLPYHIPEFPGEYRHIFQPFLIQTDPLTGEEVRISAGTPVTFTVIVGVDRSVTVIHE